MLLLAGSGLALRYGTARAASIPDSVCTSAQYTADLAARTGNDTITFNCASAATINVTSGAGGPGTVTVASGETLTIQSIGKPVTLTGAGSAQLFEVKQGGSGPGTLNLINLTLTAGSAPNGGAIYTNGVVSLSNCVLSDNTAPEGGGALFVDDLGAATIKGSAFARNAATGGYTSQGGAIDSAGTLTITSSTFAKNTAVGRLGDTTTNNKGLAGDGGAIYSSGTVTISGSAFTQNTTQGGAGVLNSPGGPAAGGAVDASGGTLTISDSTFSANSATAGAGGPSGTTSAGSTGADAGGGAVNGTVGTTVTVSDSTFVGNSATAGSGGTSAMIVAVGTTLVLGPGGSAFGGAMDVSGGGVGAVTGGGAGPHSGGGVGAVTISASTFTSNSATGGGGSPGGAGYAGAMDVSGGGVGAIARGSVATVAGALSDNIVFGNTASTGGANCVLDPTVTDGGYNLTNTGDTGCGFAPARHDVLTAAPALGTLDNNGGSAQTIALAKDSPALDAIPPDSAATPTGCGVANGPLASDERGVARPQGSGCDIGAYELAPASATQLTADPTSIVLGQTVQLCATVAGSVSGTGTPTGTVTFLDGTSTIGTGTLANGAVCISTSGLGLGTHAITASYGGDAQFDPSVSAAVTVTVGINGEDVAGAPGSGNNTSAPLNGNAGAAGNTNGASGTGQQSQSAAPSGSSAARLPYATSPARPAVSGAWPAGLMFALGALLLLGGLSGLAVVMARAARM